MKTIRTLVGRLREFKKPAILTPLFIIGEVILECLIPLTMVTLVDALDGMSLSPVMSLGLILTGLAFASLACGILSARFAATASVGLAKNLRQDLFFKVQDFSFADIDRFSTSSLVTRMTTDVTNVQNAFGMLIRIAVRVPLMIVFSIVMAFRINVQMALIFLGMVPVLAIILAAIVLVAFPIFRRIFKKYDALNNSVQENVAAIRVVKSLRTSWEAARNFVVSCSSVTKDLTTRIAATFSCTELFSASYFLKMRRKIGKAMSTMAARMMARTGTIPRKMRAIWTLMRHAMTIENTIMRGTRTAIRMSMPKAF